MEFKKEGETIWPGGGGWGGGGVGGCEELKTVQYEHVEVQKACIALGTITILAVIVDV